jgi:CheY-like chemotaxis protein
VHDPEAESRPSDPSDPARQPATGELAHELGNRLAAIVAFSHLIRTDPRLPDDLHDQAGLLVEEADRTRQLVEQLLDATRTGAPVSGSSVRAARDPSASPQARRSARILVLDDEAAIRDFLDRVLRRLGYDPVVAATGDEALAIIRSATPPDAILSDHRMAGMTGAAFHDAVRGESPELAARFAFMSGNVADPTLQALAAERGVVLLAKPFDLDQVADTVAGLVAEAEEKTGR